MYFSIWVLMGQLQVHMRLRALCTVHLWEEVNKDKESFINWFTQLIVQDSLAETQRLMKKKGKH